MRGSGCKRGQMARLPGMPPLGAIPRLASIIAAGEVARECDGMAREGLGGEHTEIEDELRGSFSGEW